MAADTAESVAAERDANTIIEQELQRRLRVAEEAAKADVLAYFGPMYPPADDQIKDAVEAISARRTALKLLVRDFDADVRLGPAIRGYYHLLRDYQMRRGHEMLVIHTGKGYVGF